MFDPLHEVAYKICGELKGAKVELSCDGIAEITVGRPTSDVDVVSVLRKYGFDVTDCDPSELDSILFKDCFGAFRGNINGKRVLGLIYYTKDKKKVLSIKMFYFNPPSGGQA